MIAIFVANPHASTMFTLVQYSRELIALTELMIFLKNIKFYDTGFSGKTTPIMLGESPSKYGVDVLVKSRSS